MLTLEQFGKYIDKNSYKPKQVDLLFSLNKGMEEAHVTTPIRIAMFLAQTTHETGGFKWFSELGDDDYFKKYEGRRDLGNTHPGDGPRFRGRGMIQITGRFNYTKAAKDLGIDLVTTPELAADIIPGARIAGWFWTTHTLNDPSDAGDIRTVTKKINGGLNGLDDRTAWYMKAKRILGV